MIGDIVRSKSIEDREAAQEKLKLAMKRVNADFASEFWAPFVITRGDEIAAVLISFVHVNDIMNELQRNFFPFRLRFGIAQGELTTALESHLATEIDGPAFYSASAMIDKAREKNHLAYFQLGNDVLDRAVSSLKNAIGLLQSDWTLRQTEVFYRFVELRNQYDVARILQIKQPTVKKTLSSIHSKEILSFEEDINYLLQNYDQVCI
ncbi:MAG: hypothetical protein GXO76_01285 [Calditrichaeota bacterium]|nr:hypothetical protein [Calditrichota bacterium]